MRDLEKKIDMNTNFESLGAKVRSIDDRTNDLGTDLVNFNIFI